MSTGFIPAGELLGPDHQVRTVVINADPHLPDGEYCFVDSYCTEPGCDCRKTIIQVFHDDERVSIVSYGWESAKFYTAWMKPLKDPKLAREMSGLSVDILGPDLVSPKDILTFMNRLMDETWIAKIKESYRRIREIVETNNIIRLPPKLSRNAACPCGSGKKFKHCCL